GRTFVAHLSHIERDKFMPALMKSEERLERAPLRGMKASVEREAVVVFADRGQASPPQKSRCRTTARNVHGMYPPLAGRADLRAAFVRTLPASVAEAHQAQASADGRSQPRSRPGSSSAAAWLRTRLTC